MSNKATIYPAGTKFAVISDIDGTLALNGHRSHYVERPKCDVAGCPIKGCVDCDGWKADWKSFFAAMPEDPPNVPVINAFHLMTNEKQIAALLVSGRGEEYRQVTERWLKKYFVYYDRLYMRPAKDYRSDTEIKLEILAQIRADGIEPLVVLEDRNRLVKMWREQGITCFQVAEGNF